MSDLTDMIYSDAYADYLIPAYILEQEEFRRLSPEDYRGLPLNAQYAVLYARRSASSASLSSSYNAVPKLYMPLGTESLEFSGITRVLDQPLLDLSGRGILLGFVDTGIDYTHPAFLDPVGSSRILGLWDQSLSSGSPPVDFPYGSEYSREQLNRALASGDPRKVVPSADERGHGTAVAGIAAGSEDPAAGFTGAAPEAGILAVKLKPAKPYLRRFYFAGETADVYEENDILAGIAYLIRRARELQMPLVLCLALGTNQGGHSGSLPLSAVLDRYGNLPGLACVCGCGSEAGRSHHFFSSGSSSEGSVRAEILVQENTPGFLCEIWGQAPQKLSVGFRSPAGETIPRIPAGLQQREEIEFALENTLVQIEYNLILPSSGSQLIRLRFQDPSPGIWELRIYSSEGPEEDFHIWLPMTGFLERDVVFLSPDPYTTLTAPSDAEAGISVSVCDARDGSLYADSGRGFTRLSDIKPDLTAPGVDLTAPGPSGSYLSLTGSSASAALTAGAAALLMEWGIKRRDPQYLTAYEIKILLIRGAGRQNNLSYPGREWGYGILNLYQTLLAITAS